MVAFECRHNFGCQPEFLAAKDKNFSRSDDRTDRNFESFNDVSNQILLMDNNLVWVKCSDMMSDHNVKLAGHIQNLVGQCPMTECYFQPCILKYKLLCLHSTP